MIGKVRTILAAAVSAVVAAAIIGGLILVGPPARERIRRLDDRRVEDLRALARAVDVYWTRQKSLPASLEELTAEEDFARRTRDPETEALYEYRVLGDKEYELCAHFSRAMNERETLLQPDFWDHPSGRWCYQLEARELKR